MSKSNGKEPARRSHPEKRRSTGSSASGSATKRRSLGGRTGVEGLLVQRTFKNTLPDIPAVPKFLSLPFLDSSRFVEYQHTTLEKAYKSLIHVGKDLGVPVELVDPAVYEGGKNFIMHPHDEALLKDPPSAKNQDVGEDGNVAWLRNTTYISTDNRSYGRDGQDWSDNKIMGGHVVTEEIEEYQSRDAQIESIESTFDAASRSKLVHPGNPNLTPVEVTPILPSREFWGQQFLHGAFDNDPTSSLKLLEKQSVGTRRNYLAQGMLTQRRDEGATVAEFSLFLPQKTTYEQRRAVQSGEADDIAVGEAYTFDKARDYVLELKDNLEHDTFVMATHDGKTVYKTFAGRVKLNRRRERVKGRRTGKVTLSVTHRGPTAEEDTDEREQLLPLYYTELEQGSTATADDGAAAPDEGTALNDTEQAASADEDNVGDES